MLGMHDILAHSQGYICIESSRVCSSQNLQSYLCKTIKHRSCSTWIHVCTLYLTCAWMCTCTCTHCIVLLTWWMMTESFFWNFSRTSSAWPQVLSPFLWSWISTFRRCLWIMTSLEVGGSPSGSTNVWNPARTILSSWISFLSPSAWKNNISRLSKTGAIEFTCTCTRLLHCTKVYIRPLWSPTRMPHKYGQVTI